MIREIKIGNVTIPNNIILAPMAGVSDLPFRLLCREKGAGLVCMEMISAKALLYNNKNTRTLLEINPEERPVSLQLFGKEPDLMAEMAKKIEELPFDILDINMGCPVPKIVNNREGSALMKEPQLVEEIVKKVAAAVNKPVTVKIRKGFDAHQINAVEIAKIAESAGAAAVTVHGRTREEYYSGTADWNIIRAVKENVGIPVIGSGDVVSGETAKRMLEETGCDGLMIGRGARGNPWIFDQILEYARTGKEKVRPDAGAIRAMMIRHAALQVRYKGEYIGIREMRKHVAWYTAGLPGSSRLRSRVNEITSMETLAELLENMMPNQ